MTINFEVGARVWSYHVYPDLVKFQEHEILKVTPKTFQIKPYTFCQLSDNLKKADVKQLYATYDEAYAEVKDHIHGREVEVCTYDVLIQNEEAVRQYLEPRSDVQDAGTSIKWDNLVEGEDCEVTGMFGRKMVTVFPVHGVVDRWSFTYEGHSGFYNKFKICKSRDEAISALIEWIEDKIVYNY